MLHNLEDSRSIRRKRNGFTCNEEEEASRSVKPWLTSLFEHCITMQLLEKNRWVTTRQVLEHGTYKYKKMKARIIHVGNRDCGDQRMINFLFTSNEAMEFDLGILKSISDITMPPEGFCVTRSFSPKEFYWFIQMIHIKMNKSEEEHFEKCLQMIVTEHEKWIRIVSKITHSAYTSYHVRYGHLSVHDNTRTEGEGSNYINSTNCFTTSIK
jgi:hypothetical protein